MTCLPILFTGSIKQTPYCRSIRDLLNYIYICMCVDIYICLYIHIHVLLDIYLARCLSCYSYSSSLPIKNLLWTFPNGSSFKECTRNAGDTGEASSTHGSKRSPGRGNGTPLQHSCLKNPMDRGAWWATVHRVTKSRTQLSMHQS